MKGDPAREITIGDPSVPGRWHRNMNFREIDAACNVAAATFNDDDSDALVEMMQLMETPTIQLLTHVTRVYRRGVYSSPDAIVIYLMTKSYSGTASKLNKTDLSRNSISILMIFLFRKMSISALY